MSDTGGDIRKAEVRVHRPPGDAGKDVFVHMSALATAKILYLDDEPVATGASRAPSDTVP